MMLTRRDLFRTAGASTVASLLPPLTRPIFADTGDDPIQGFTSKPEWQAVREVLRAAANRIIPPFRNEKLEFAGAGNEGAVEYIEQLLTAFDDVTDEQGNKLPPRIYPSVRKPGDPSGSYIGSHGDPSECQGGHLAVPGGWLQLPPDKELGWRRAIARFQAAYQNGLARLDEDSGAQYGVGFVALPPILQTALLQLYDGANQVNRISGVYSAGGGEAALRPSYEGPPNERVEFFNLLATHTMEAIYGDPIYRGAPADSRIGWKLVGFGGPRHPEGYFEDELETRANCDFGIPGNQDILKNVL